MICLTQSKFLFLPYTKQGKIFFKEKELFKEKGELNPTKKKKEGLLIALDTAIKKDSTTSMRRHVNELTRNGIKCLKNLFWRRVETIIEKKWLPYCVDLRFFVYLLILMLIL